MSRSSAREIAPPTVRNVPTSSESNTAQAKASSSDETGPLIVKAATALEAFRHNEYDAKYAVGEMVDNSLESGAKNVWIEYETAKRQQAYKKKELAVVNRMVVIDDGSGMNRDHLSRALVLGESIRPADRQLGIGRFGVGLTMGGLALARSITVISRTAPDAPFNGVVLDLDEVRDTGRAHFSPAVPMEPPSAYAQRLAKSSGTIVLLDKCDRLQVSTESDRLLKADDVISGMPNFLGRTYRKFIAAGRQLWFQDKQVYLHDPLFLMSPTMHDEPELDAKATVVLQESIDVPIPGRETSVTAPVTITVSLLPEVWRQKVGSGRSADAEKRQIPENQGVSILRADREVLYREVPYLIGAKGQAKYEELDRFWGCEIAFPPELDEHFEVRFIKRGAQPKPELRDQIKAKLSPIIKQLRQEISRHWTKTQSDDAKDGGVYRQAEEVINAVAASLPKSRRKPKQDAIETVDADSDGAGSQGSGATKQDPIAKIAEQAAKAIAPDDLERQEEVRDSTAQRLSSNVFSIVPVEYPESVFFDTEYHDGKVIVKLNVHHPFYGEVFVPLCGPLATESQPSVAVDPVKHRARIAFQLILMSYAQAEAMFDETNEGVFSVLRGQWGMTLGAAVRRMPQFTGALDMKLGGDE